MPLKLGEIERLYIFGVSVIILGIQMYTYVYIYTVYREDTSRRVDKQWRKLASYLHQKTKTMN